MATSINPEQGLSIKSDLIREAREIFLGNTPVFATLVSILVTIFLLYLVTDFIMPSLFHTRPLFYAGPYYGPYYRTGTVGRAAERRKRRGAFPGMEPAESHDLTDKVIRAIKQDP